jgi:hypothetical protein
VWRACKPRLREAPSAKERRNPKHEVRNKFEDQNPKARNGNALFRAFLFLSA